MAGWRGGKWRGRPNQGQIEDMAVQKVAEFRRKLQAAGLSVPEIPPVSSEYLALTITELSVRGVEQLLHEGKSLAGMLDMAQAEIVYEEADAPGRQNFTIAHELGHYFLHYLPAVEMARQPTLFDTLNFPHPEPDEKLERAEQPRPVRFFRCSEVELVEEETDNPSTSPTDAKPTRLGRRELEDLQSKTHLAKIIRLRDLANRLEWEANIFARGLLMPSELVRWLSKKHTGDVAAIATELGVTQTALRYRMNGLGLRQDDDKGLGPAYGVRPKSPNSPQQGTFF